MVQFKASASGQVPAPALEHAPLGLARRFMADTGGATAIEYALIAGGVGAAVASAVWTLGGEIKTMLYDKLPGLF